MDDESAKSFKAVGNPLRVAIIALPRAVLLRRRWRRPLRSLLFPVRSRVLIREVHMSPRCCPLILASSCPPHSRSGALASLKAEFCAWLCLFAGHEATEGATRAGSGDVEVRLPRDVAVAHQCLFLRRTGWRAWRLVANIQIGKRRCDGLNRGCF